jgi:hypothetical protein
MTVEHLMLIGLFRVPHPFLFPRKVKADAAENKQPGWAMLGPCPGQRRIGCPSEWLKTANTPPVGECLSTVGNDKFRAPIHPCDFQNSAFGRFNQTARVWICRAEAPAMKLIKFSHHLHNARNAPGVEVRP